MSTKITIKHYFHEDHGFHLYTECYDNDAGPIYLELNGVKFTADSDGNVVVEIPREWATELQLIPITT